MYYSDDEFALKVKDKPGNVRVFKKFLREYGMFEARKQLSDEHIPIFLEIVNVRNKEKSIWVDAMKKVLESYATTKPLTDTELLKEILVTVQRIEKKMK